MVHFREKGEELFRDHIQCFITGEASLRPWQKKVRKYSKLHNFDSIKLDKSNKTEKQPSFSKMMRSMVQWCKEHGVSPGQIDQFIKVPLSIACPDGLPYKGNKSSTANFYRKNVPDAFTNGSLHVRAEAFVVDAMFIIRTKPLPSHDTFKKYTHFLFQNWVIYHLRQSFNKVKEVHIVFDLQNHNINTPKLLEQSRRDRRKSLCMSVHIDAIQADTPVPRQWQDFLSLRQNRTNLVHYISDSFVEVAQQALQGTECVFVGGARQGAPVYRVCQGNVTLCEGYKNNHIEGDSMVWLHAALCDYSNVLIYSPDNDIYNIGLGMLSEIPSKTFNVQLKSRAQGSEFLNLNILLNSLSKNTNLKKINTSIIGKIFQTLYISTGCDYVSYFKHHGKTSFYNSLFDYAEFITGDTSLPGTLDMIEESNLSLGFFSFLRLVGVEYFKSVASKFSRQLQRTRADDLFRSALPDANGDIKSAHAVWLEKIRAAIGFAAESEEYYLPSTDELELHWKRVCWVAQVWGSAGRNIIEYAPLEEYGWEFKDGVLSVV